MLTDVPMSRVTHGHSESSTPTYPSSISILTVHVSTPWPYYIMVGFP